MDIKDVYAALERLGNGADLITAIKGEINTLNNKAKKNRVAGEHTAEKSRMYSQDWRSRLYTGGLLSVLYSI